MDSGLKLGDDVMKAATYRGGSKQMGEPPLFTANDVGKTDLEPVAIRS